MASVKFPSWGVMQKFNLIYGDTVSAACQKTHTLTHTGEEGEGRGDVSTPGCRHCDILRRRGGKGGGGDVQTLTPSSSRASHILAHRPSLTHTLTLPDTHTHTHGGWKRMSPFSIPPRPPPPPSPGPMSHRQSVHVSMYCHIVTQGGPLSLPVLLIGPSFRVCFSWTRI